MKTYLRTKAFALFIVLLLPVTAVSTVENYLKFRIDDSIEPDSIPTWVKLDELLKSYKGELDSELDSIDRAVLIRTIRDVAWTRGVIMVLQAVRGHTHLCPMLAKGADAPSMAKRSEELSIEDDKNLQLTYQEMFDNLSQEGELAVMSYLETKVTSSLIYTKPDYQKIAFDNSVIYLSNMEKYCSAPLAGELVIEVLRDGQFRSISKTIR